MPRLQLRVYDLRKKKQIGQKELASRLGVAVQTVSKWENGVCMPDISMLPELASFFQVSVDELLGLKPLAGEEYIPVRSGEKEYWEQKLNYLIASRKSFWNEDYLQFLIEKVWKIEKPVDILDCGCGFGFMGKLLLTYLPEGSTYTGIDFSQNMIEEGKRFFREAGYRGEFICVNFWEFESSKKYDFVFSQCAMRHVNEPQKFLRKMIKLTKSGGMVVAIDVNRETESDGLYIDGLDYQELCSRDGFRKMWEKELVCQGRDYAVGMRMPIMMQQEGLVHVDVRMNDKVSFVSPEVESYKEAVDSFLEEKEWNKKISAKEEEEMVQGFLNHGMDREEAESYCRKQRKIQSFVVENQERLTYLSYRGLLVSYGWKK